MTAFCHVDDAYNPRIKDDVDLDKMAREVNEQKKRNAQDIYRNYRKDTNTLARGVTAYNNIKRDEYDKGTHVPDITQGFFSAQGDYTDLINTLDNQDTSALLISDIIEKKKNPKINNLDMNLNYPESKRKLRVKRKNKDTNFLNNVPKANTFMKNTINDNANDWAISSISESDDYSADLQLNPDTVSELSDISFLDDKSDDTLISNIYLNSHSKPLSKIKPKKINEDQITLEDIYREIKLGSKFNQKADEAARNFRKKKAKRCIDYDLQSIDSLESLESGESLLEHINDCERCRNHVVELIRKSKKNRKTELMGQIVEGMNKRTNIIEEELNASDEVLSNNSMNAADNGFDLKELFTICLIGFLVIIILDLTINYKNK